MYRNLLEYKSNSKTGIDHSEEGFDISEKSVKYYAKVKDDEYILIRW